MGKIKSLLLMQKRLNRCKVDSPHGPFFLRYLQKPYESGGYRLFIVYEWLAWKLQLTNDETFVDLGFGGV